MTASLTRRRTLPQTVRLQSIAGALFRYDKIPDSLVAGIRSLDCTGANDETLVAVASLLKRLKNLDKLDMTRREYPLLRSRGTKTLSDLECQLAREAYGENAPRITRFVMQDGPDGGGPLSPAGFLRSFADPGHLVDLSVTLTETWHSVFGSDNRMLQSIVASCTQLRKLKVRENHPTSTASLTPEEQTRWRAASICQPSGSFRCPRPTSPRSSPFTRGHPTSRH